jgi:hypothetical protein
VTGRRLAVGAIVVAMIAILVVVGGPTGEEPTHAFVAFLQASGIDTRASSRPPGPPGTFVLLADARSAAQERPLLDWVDAGGRLVITDPSSIAVAQLGMAPGDRAGLIGPTTLSPGCLDSLAVGVRGLVVDAADRTVRASTPDAISCFPAHGGSYAVVLARGAGSIVVLGGWSFLSNDFLARADNAVAVLRLVGPGPVALGPPVPAGSAAPSVWQLLPSAGRAIVVGSILAALAFAIARARRLGRPVEEPVPAPIPASALVEASAGLYRRARAAGYCGRVVRDSARGRLARAVGAAPDAGAEALAADVSRMSGIPQPRVLAALAGDEPRTDEELLRLVAELNLIGERTRTGPRDGAHTTVAGVEREEMLA